MADISQNANIIFIHSHCLRAVKNERKGTEEEGESKNKDCQDGCRGLTDPFALLLDFAISRGGNVSQA